MKAFISGVAGFIGSNLADRLLEMGYYVRGYDNFATGQKKFISRALSNPKFDFIEADMLDKQKLSDSLSEIDIVFHLAANADIKDGLNNPVRDLEQNTIATSNILEAMRINNVKKILFSSTGSVYGEACVIPTPENAPFPIQTSLYASSKLACEALIQAYCEGYGFKSWIFRFVSVLGERYSHGHVFDFYKKLLDDPNNLLVLGDGNQKKSYLYVQDCIDAMLFSLENSKEKINIFNLGTNEYCQVKDSIKWIVRNLEINPKLNFTGGKRGWVGDNPFIFLDTSKINNLGWKPKLSINDGVIKTLEYLKSNKWLIKERE